MSDALEIHARGYWLPRTLGIWGQGNRQDNVSDRAVDIEAIEDTDSPKVEESKT